MQRGLPAILRQVPNALSALRLIIAGLFPLVPAPWLVVPVVIGAGSDLLDGVLARYFGWTSRFGGILDGFADKAFTVSALATLTWHERLLVWQLLILLSRDMIVAITTAAAAIANRWDLLEHRLLGKLTTAGVFALMLLLTVWPNQRAWFVGLFVVSAILSLLAALDYGAAFLRALRRAEIAGESES